MKLLGLFILTICSSGWAQIQIPEDCLQQEVAPCLVRTEQPIIAETKEKTFSYLIPANSILKWSKFNEVPEVDILEGYFYVKKKKELKQIKLNGMLFEQNTLFISKVRKMLKVLDGDRFLLSEFNLVSDKGADAEFVKIEFLDKKNLVEFLSGFFKTRPQLVAFLKNNEAKWVKEFALQNATQTKVLKRAIASIAESEKQEQENRRRSEKELKKVREEFFYRTFFR